MLRSKMLCVASLSLILACAALGQSQAEPGVAREIGSGAGTVGVGAAKGAGEIAKGTGKAAADLVTLHPIDAGASIGKGAASAGKDVTAGTVKGTGKVAKGVGRAFKHLF